MKKTMLCLFGIPFLAVAGEALPDLRGYKDGNKEFDSSAVFEETFDGPLEGWNFNRKKFEIRKGEGVNGTPCLFYERTDPKEYVFMMKPIRLQSNLEYECVFRLRTEDIQFRDTDQRAFKDQVAAMGIQYRGNGRWITISPAFAKHKELKPGEWQIVRFPVRQPAGKNVTASFDIYLRQGITGKMWIDDITVRPVLKTSALLYPVASGMRVGPDGRLRFRAVQLGDPVPDSDLGLYVTAGKVTRLLRGREGMFEGNFGSFAPGKVPVNVRLLDTKRKLILASGEYTYVVPSGKPPAGAAVLDDCSRLLVDGKPFMPVAVFSGFTYPPTRKDLERLKEAGFNTLLYYHPYKYLYIDGRKPTRKEDLLSSLDAMKDFGIKLIFATFRQNLPNQVGVREEFDHIRGMDNVTEYVIGLVKDHPAMLAYYLSDENPLKEYPSVKRLRERVSAVDPWHPTVTLTNRTDYFTACAATGDILSYDYYPINTVRDQSFQYEGIESAGNLGIPHWFTPQAFHWGAARRHHPFHTYRYPSEEEMRSLNLAAAIYNAKGFLFYSYADVRLQEEKLDSANGKMFWNSVRGVSSLLRELEPWIMSVEKAPETAVVPKHAGKAKVIARAFFSDGKTAVLIVSNGPGPAEAVITVPGCPALKSKYGHTRNLGDGKYLFTGENIASDVLLP
ncbi:MAG: hypothetical protein BWY31_00417 [Lentisphaerae bacterium ADurb.Bin242]|nr:MAG: hypothetical protein BWY31_00417 [Lentisphaerae bacterium ADurb.Bin242]